VPSPPAILRCARLAGFFIAFALLRAFAAAPTPGANPTLVVPRVARPPELEDFLDMEPKNGMEDQMVKVEGFLQRVPSDGQPGSQRTLAYLGYDQKNLYVVFVCFDTEPDKLRARRVSRENIFGDDLVSIDLDTFHDQRRAYIFAVNPLGIQNDSIWTEGQGFDGSFDTVWDSKGRLTPHGYVVWMSIPFKSLRFPAQRRQTWGVILNRDVPRLNEETYWPHYSSRIEGRLNQTARLEGLEDISPGRNIQLIPFGVFRTFRALDTRDPLAPRFAEDHADPDAGLDAKFIFRDSLVLDVAVNPDFSQVESDEPQVTVNQRFEVFFPEKRPFFLENANYFVTPIDLVFTRRIGDPSLGVRLTGKTGPWALGAFVIDDEGPGKRILRHDPLHGRRAYYGIVRLSRDVFQQSTLGLIYTDREFAGASNRVGGLDGRFKLSENWVFRFQGVASTTRCLTPEVRARIFFFPADACRFDDPLRLTGPAYDAQITRSGRQLNYNLEYNDRSDGFRTAPGFLLRPDIRRVGQQVGYAFRPEGKWLISWGPFFNTEAVFDHSGTRLDLTQDNSITFEFVGQTEVGALYNWDRERLRPRDFPVLVENEDFSRNRKGVFFSSSYFRSMSFSGQYTWGTRINFVPAAGDPPVLSNVATGQLGLTLRPTTALRVDNTYIFARLTDRVSDANIFQNHILRSKWNYQFTRELSARVILQYNSVLSNPTLTALPHTKNFNADFLVTYLVHPGTVLYVGYNGNAQNLDLIPTSSGAEIVRPRDRFVNDARQFFVKFSYLFRF
jgi:hypothetical protein